MLRYATLCDAMRRYISLATENIEIPSGFFDVQRPAKGHWLVHIASPAPGQRGPWAGTNNLRAIIGPLYGRDCQS